MRMERGDGWRRRLNPEFHPNFFHFLSPLTSTGEHEFLIIINLQIVSIPLNFLWFQVGVSQISTPEEEQKGEQVKWEQ